MNYIVRVHRWLFYLILLPMMAPGRSYSQTLEIQLPGPLADASQALIWGQVQLPAILIGTDLIPLQEAPIRLPPPPPPPRHQVVKSKLAATFLFTPEEEEACSEARRFVAFLALVKALGTKVQSVHIEAADAWSACRDEVAARLRVRGIPLEIMPLENARTVKLAVQFTGDALSDEPQPAAPPEAVVEAPARSVSAPRLIIDGKTVAIGEGGWFVFLAENYRELTLTYEHPGYQVIERQVSPWPTLIGASAAPAGAPFKRINVVAQGTTLSIRLLPDVPVAKDLVLDINPGFGFGRAEGIPGEVGGRRAAFAASLALRRLIPGYRVRWDVSGTLAKESAVPWTLLSDLAIVKDGAIFESWGLWNVGLGGQVFTSKVTAPQGASRAQSANSTVVPEFVLAPLITLGFQIASGSFYGGTQINYTPLFLIGAGFYPSLNGSVEAGWRLSEGLSLVLGGRVDTIRYPTPNRVTVLSLETLYLGLNLGFFT